MSTNGRTRAWVEVQAGALRKNLRTVRDRLPKGTGLVPMVKADAYGLGMVRAAQALKSEDPVAFGVATVEEGRDLRQAGLTEPILVCSPAPPASLPDAIEAKLTVTASDTATLARLRDAGAAASFHIEIDTGMGRSGLDWRAVSEWSQAVHEAATVARWTGCFTHYHSANLAGTDSVAQQSERFGDALATLDLPQDNFLLHTANSAAALRAPLWAGPGRAVRPGIFLYGGEAGEELPTPETVASLRARTVLVKDVAPGTTLGYGATHRATGWERWATVALGYGDGLPRALSNRGRCLIKGRHASIIGRISMDVSVVDITGRDDVSVGDVVTFMGADGTASISPDEIAQQTDTIAYEVLTGITKRVPRIWIDEGG